MGGEPSPVTAAAASSDKNANAISNDDVLNVNIGVLGHVDSGKTSLVKALSTLLSTAALDKSKQSRQRGMTLDLGFSCFFVDMPTHLISKFPTKKKLQITLVDCPGHASLIRTIIGGAQIIDMVLLVVDAYKGWQAQTTECLVLAELTSKHLVVALNKVDMLSADEQERTEQLNKVKSNIKKRLQQTKFNKNNIRLIPVSACVGGEKVAAIDTEEDTIKPSKGSLAAGAAAALTTTSSTAATAETSNVDELVQTIKEELPPPNRTASGTFYFSIDHCFPIRGRGTVLTGTCLNGSININDNVEIPSLGYERKIKSIQMFKRQVSSIMQGDRAAVCVSNLDSKLLERGIACKPGAISLLKGAIVLVRKVKYFPYKLLCNSKFHISVGHTTIMANVTFFGAHELAKKQKQLLLMNKKIKEEEEKDKKEDEKKQNPTLKRKSQPALDDEMNDINSTLNSDVDIAGLPKLPFTFDEQFIQQDHLLESLDENTKKNKGTTAETKTSEVISPSSSSSSSTSSSLLHWALLDFQIPVYCPLNSLIIGSRLDLDTSDSTTTDAANNANNSNTDSSGATSSCRLAFCGRIIEKIDPTKDLSRLKLYTWKEKRGVISRLGDPHRRNDDNKIVRYEVFGSDLFKKETNMKVFIGMKVCTPINGEVGEIKSSFGTSGKFRVFFPAGTEAREGDPLILKFKRYTSDPNKIMHQDDIIIPSPKSGTRIEPTQNKKNKNKKNKGGAGAGKNNNSNKAGADTAVATTAVTTPAATANANTAASSSTESAVVVGDVVSVKGDIIEGSDNKYSMAIISGFFSPEVNIRDEKLGLKVRIPSTNEEGTIAGPFGKAGKCKVSFLPNGISESAVGAKAELLPTT